jgi:hypothetical protein
MTGEKNLDKLLKKLKPTRKAGDYVFCTTKDLRQIKMSEIIFFFREEEGLTVVLEKQVADRLHLHYTFVAAWITLTVHSSLEAVGLTAAFSKALTNENISCNVVAGYFHDHLFVDKKDAERTMIVLKRFSEE